MKGFADPDQLLPHHYTYFRDGGRTSISQKRCILGPDAGGLWNQSRLCLAEFRVRLEEGQRATWCGVEPPGVGQNHLAEEPRHAAILMASSQDFSLVSFSFSTCILHGWKKWFRLIWFPMLAQRPGR